MLKKIKKYIIQNYGIDYWHTHMGLVNTYLNNQEKFKLIEQYGEIVLVSDLTDKKNKGIKELMKDTITYECDVGKVENKKELLNITKEMSEKKNLYIYGGACCGKTSMVITIANKLYEKKKENYLYITLPEFFLKNMKSENDTLVETIKKTKSLIIDDFGLEHITKQTRDLVLFPILKYRFQNNLETIIIGTESLEKNKKKYYLVGANNSNVDSFFERIKKNCKIIEIK